MLNRMPIRVKLFILLFVPIIAIIFSSYNTISNVRLLIANKRDLIDSNILVLNIDRDLHQAFSAQQHLILSEKGTDDYREHLKTYKENMDQSQARMGQLKQIVNRNKETLNNIRHPRSQETIYEQFEHFERDFPKWQDASQRLIDQAARLSTTSKNLMLFSTQGGVNESYHTFRQARVHVDELTDMLELAAKKRIERDIQLTQQVTTQSITIAIVTIGVVAVLGFLFIHLITHPLQQIALATKQVASGNLTVKVPRVYSQDTISLVAISVNTMIDNLRELVHQVSISSESVSAAAEQLSASSTQTSKATELVAHSIAQVASGMEHQSKQVSVAADNVNEMVINLQEMATHVESVAIASTEVKKLSGGGQQMLTNVITQMEVVNEHTNQTTYVLQALEEQSKQINQIIEVIDHIAKQTNLLALNAAIESARAGEHGRGFSVVASEVRILAEQTTDSTKQIASIIVELQSKMKQAATSMANGKKEVNKGVDLVTQTGAAFQEIQTAVADVSNKIGQISGSTNQLASHSTLVMEKIAQVEERNRENTSKTLDISSASEEQLASLEQVTSSTNELAKMAEALQRLVGRFTV